MNFTKIIEQCGHIRVNEKRASSTGYEEWVIHNEDIGEWDAVLFGIFGPAIKPKGVKATRQNFMLTEKFGGIYQEQTLYYKDFGGEAVIAMLWPWENKLFVTLKFAQVNGENDKG